MRRPLQLTALVAALALLPATAALAHPALNPNAVPVGEPVETTLVVPHGCSTGAGVMPEEGQAVPTARVDLQLLDGISIDPGEVDGWDAEDDGEAIVWTDAGGATTDPIELPMTLTVQEGSPGDELALAAYQECEDGSSYRWTEGSGDTPPVALELTEGEVGTESDVDPDAGHDTHGATSEADDGDATSTEDATEPTSDATTPDAAPAADDDGGIDGAVVAAVAAIVVAVAAGITSLVRRKGTA